MEPFGFMILYLFVLFSLLRFSIHARQNKKVFGNISTSDVHLLELFSLQT